MCLCGQCCHQGHHSAPLPSSSGLSVVHVTCCYLNVHGYNITIVQKKIPSDAMGTLCRCGCPWFPIGVAFVLRPHEQPISPEDIRSLEEHQKVLLLRLMKSVECQQLFLPIATSTCDGPSYSLLHFFLGMKVYGTVRTPARS